MSAENVVIRGSDPALDPRVLAELANMQRNGRPGFMDRLITLYLQTAAELIADLEASKRHPLPMKLLGFSVPATR